MLDEDWEKFTVFAVADKFTLYTNHITDEMNSFLQARDDLKEYKVLVVRMNGSSRAEYTVINPDNNMIFHHPAMQNVEDFINTELAGVVGEI